jgi:pilus assembly protein Flp/PilA
MRTRALRDEERGATAVEYGLIAGLIALGILGSLVGTRTSLVAAFGGVSGQMGTATGAPAASPSGVTSQRTVAAANTSTRYGFWNAKTVSSKTVTNPDANSRLTSFTYSDGSYASYLVKYDASGKLVGETVNSYPLQYSGRSMDSAQFTYAADGSQLTMIYDDRYANGVVKQHTESAASNGWKEAITYYNSDGSYSRSATYTTGSDLLGIGTADEVYFRAVSQ